MLCLSSSVIKPRLNCLLIFSIVSLVSSIIVCFSLFTGISLSSYLYNNVSLSLVKSNTGVFKGEYVIISLSRRIFDVDEVYEIIDRIYFNQSDHNDESQ